MGLVQETGQLLSRLPTHRSVCQRDAGETVGPKKAACRDGPILLKNSKMELKQKFATERRDQYSAIECLVVGLQSAPVGSQRGLWALT